MSVSWSQTPASLEIFSCVPGDLSVCCQGTGGIITQHCSNTPAGLQCLPSLGVTCLLGGSQCLVESVGVISSFGDVFMGVASLCAALLNDITHLGQLKVYGREFFC